MTSLMEIRDNRALIDYINHGNTVKYVYFWGHQPAANGPLTKSCFSQWYEMPFDNDGVRYKTAEHFMMAKKAELFEDYAIVDKIISANHPAEAKKFGRAVKGFNEKVWLDKRFNLVVEGNLAKFSQHTGLKQFIKQTGDRVLVEASPVDKIWGVGLAESDIKITDPYQWKGLNLLGFALMEVRSQL